MKLTTYAEVFTPDHPLATADMRGHERPAGHLLADVLREAGGRYEATVDLPQRFRDDALAMAGGPDDGAVAALAARSSVTVSLEHLRECDPGSTRIVYGCRLEAEPGDRLPAHWSAPS